MYIEENSKKHEQFFSKANKVAWNSVGCKRNCLTKGEEIWSELLCIVNRLPPLNSSDPPIYNSLKSLVFRLRVSSLKQTPKALQIFRLVKYSAPPSLCGKLFSTDAFVGKNDLCDANEFLMRVTLMFIHSNYPPYFFVTIFRPFPPTQTVRQL